MYSICTVCIHVTFGEPGAVVWWSYGPQGVIYHTADL